MRIIDWTSKSGSAFSVLKNAPFAHNYGQFLVKFTSGRERITSTEDAARLIMVPHMQVKEIIHISSGRAVDIAEPYCDFHTACCKVDATCDPYDHDKFLRSLDDTSWIDEIFV